MTLVKTSLLNGIAVAIKVITGLLLNKILAVYVGPAGYAVIGQFQNAVSMIVSLAGGVVATGVTKATAQHFDDEARQHAVWQTAIRFSLGASLLAAFSLLLIGNSLADWLLRQPDMSSVFVWLALALPAIAANSILLAIVNGKKEVGVYVTVNIIGSLVALLATGLLAVNFGLYGALVAFAISPAIVVLSTATIVARRRWFRARYLWGQMNRPALRELAGFGLMAVTSALVVPVSYMIIRGHLATQLGMPAAGYWQGIWTISGIYLMLITSTLSVYYLPRLAEIREAAELRTEIAKVYRFVMPIVLVSAAAIYLLRDFIIQVLFTVDFVPMRELFGWQATGDVIKIGSWILGYFLLARAMVKSFVVTEVAFSISFVVLTWIFVDFFGLIGVSIAYAVNYTLYWACLFFLVTRALRRMEMADD